MSEFVLADKAPVAEIFRSYDIRGIVDEQLTPSVAYAVGLALGSQLQAINKPAAVVGRDVRPSSLSLQQALIQGLRECGVAVINIGAVPTPVLYFASVHFKEQCFGSGFMITGSHNPTNYNGIKMVLAGKTLHSAAIQDLYQRIVARDFIQQDKLGTYQEENIVADYIQDIVRRVQHKRPLRVVVDAGNGMAGEIAPQLLRDLGCEVDTLFCELDGTFPNHHPDPTVPENLQALQARVRELKADCGLAFDGDADRLGVVTGNGDIMWPDQQMMLYATDLLSRKPGATIVYDVKCSCHLQSVIARSGGRPLMWKTGHSLLKAKMLEENAGMAGEMSGHIFFRENWYGFDDGIYAAARFLQILSSSVESCQQIYAALPQSVTTPELKIMVDERQKMQLMQDIIQHQEEFSQELPQAHATLIDGLRVDYTGGFALLRASNTTPCIIARFEAADAEQLSAVQMRFKQVLHKIDARLKMPF